MSDHCKSELLMSMRNALIKVVDSETASIINDILTVKLMDYNVERISTALTTERVNTDDDLIRNYLACAAIEGKSKKSLYQYRQSINRLLEFTGKTCMTVTTNDIRAWLASLKLKGLKNVSIRNQRNNISSFFKWMRVEHIISEDPVETVHTMKCPKEEKKAFTSEDIDTIRSLCDITKRAIVEVLLSSGVRVNELCNLGVEDVDLDNLTVRVRNGKGGKDRTVFISPVCKKHLVTYLNNKKQPSRYLFSKDYDQTNYTPGGIRGILRKMSKQCGIHIHPHRFRRTLATECARKGMPVQEIRILLGHSNISTTQRYIDTELTQVQASYRQLIA